MSSITLVFQSVLEWIYRFVQDYGWSIVLFTLAFRFCLSPFDVISRRAMKKQTLDMARVQPQLDAIKTKYANDQDKLNKKTMEFYKQEHISPFGGCVGGCLPMLIQWPIFIAFYGAIRSISEMEIYRIYETIKTTGVANVSRWLWVQNLWQPDTFQATVLPAYSAVSKFAVFSGVTEEAYNQVMTPLMSQYSGLVNGTYILPVLAAGASFFQGWLAANLAKTPEQRVKAKENKAAGEKGRSGNHQQNYAVYVPRHVFLLLYDLLRRFRTLLASLQRSQYLLHHYY